MKKNLIRAVALTILSMGCLNYTHAADVIDKRFDIGVGDNQLISEDIEIEDDDLSGIIINNGTLNFTSTNFNIGSTGSVVSALPNHDTYYLINNSGELNITSENIDIDNHYGLNINNNSNGKINIKGKNFFIGTDYCCEEHSSYNEPSDGHQEDASRNIIINNSGNLTIQGDSFSDTESTQVIQGKIIHNSGAITNISLNGSSNPNDLEYIILEMVNYREIPLSGFVGTVDGSSDSGFSISLNSTAYWLAGKQTDKINRLELNGGAIVVGDIDLSFEKNYSGDSQSNIDPRKIWPSAYNKLTVKDFYSNGNFFGDAEKGSFSKISGIYLFTDLKNNQGDRIIFTGETPDVTIPIGIINKDDNSGEAIIPSEGHRVTVVTAPANTKMNISPKLLIYGNELNKLYGRSLIVKPFDLYSPVLETEFTDGTVDGISGEAKNWVFTGWGLSGGKTTNKEKDQQTDGFDMNATELDNTLKRINDIRTDPSEVGAWIRGESGKMKIRSYSYKYNLTSGGYDWDFESDAAKMFLGFGISYAKNDCDTGMIGDTKSMGYNLYGSWLGKDNKDYVDVILKYGKLDKKYAGLDDNNVFVRGDYDKNLFSIAAKYGRRIEREDGWYYEPSVGLTWGRIGSADFTDSQGIHIHADSSTSKMASLGMQVGKNVQGTEFYGLVQVRHDFDGKMHVSVPGSDLPGSSVYDDMGGTWYKVGIGAARKINKNNSFYLDLEKDFGNKVKKPYSIGAGYRYTW